MLVAVGSFWPCQWYIVLWPGGPSQQQHGQSPEKKKKWVGLKDSPLGTVANKQTNKASDHFSSALVFWSAWFACAASSVPYVELPTTSTTSCLSFSLFVFYTLGGGGGGGGGGGRGLEKVIILDSPGIVISREKNCIFPFAYWKNQKKTHTQSSQCMAETIATHSPTHKQQQTLSFDLITKGKFWLSGKSLRVESQESSSYHLLPEN